MAERLHVLCQCCGSADHHSSNSLLAKVCPTCKTNKNCLMYVCPLFKDAEGPQKDYRGYKSDDPSFYSRAVCQIQGRVRNIQMTLVVAPSLHQLIKWIRCAIKMCILKMNFQRVGVLPGMKQAILSLTEIPQWSSSRSNQPQPTP